MLIEELYHEGMETDLQFVFVFILVIWGQGTRAYIICCNKCVDFVCYVKCAAFQRFPVSEDN